MSRPIRIEFPDALYHVTARGDRREDIFEGDQDRQKFLSIPGGVIARFNWICHAWCLMDNLRGQVFLGDEQFVNHMQAHIQSGKDDMQIPHAQHRPQPAPLAEIEIHTPDRNAAIVAAYATGAYSYQQISDYFGVHFTTVGRIVRGAMK